MHYSVSNLEKTQHDTWLRGNLLQIIWNSYIILHIYDPDGLNSTPSLQLRTQYIPCTISIHQSDQHLVVCQRHINSHVGKKMDSPPGEQAVDNVEALV